MTTLAPPPPGLAGLEFINRDLHHQLRESHAENLGLRAVLAEHDIDAPVPPGVVTLARLRALESVLNLAQLHQRHPDNQELADQLRQAIVDAGRAP